MVIDIWSDIVCPFCYLGMRQLTRALDEFEHRGDIVIRHRAFELDRHARDSYDRPLAELLATKYSMPVEKAQAVHRRMEADAAQLGMTWNLAGAQHSNTFDGHRLIALAQAQGRGPETVENLFDAYFCQAQRISTHETLIAVAEKSGVDGAAAMLASRDYEDEVRRDEDEALDLGIGGVPALLVDGKFMLSGAQGPDAMLAVLRRAWARRTS
jgi:hypothetical protein